MNTTPDTAPTLAASVPTPMALRAELEDLIRKDLLGPAGGEEEELPRELGSVLRPLPAGHAGAAPHPPARVGERRAR
jgi:hypothetical protein